MLYVATTISSWILLSITKKAIYSRLSTEGYEYIPPKKTKDEIIQEKAKAALLMCIPVVNIMIASIMTLSFDRTYSHIKHEWIKEGKIKKKEEQQEQRVEIDLESNDINKTRKYSELSNEEKLKILEEEKARLLREKEQPKEEKTRGAYTKRKSD